ncbi:MAG: MBL fold metallo-hydrolase [Faecalibacterium sp.]
MKTRIITILLGIALLIGIALLPSEEPMTVSVLDVGKADCIVLQHQGIVFMIDTAEAEDYDKVTAFLQNEGITQIDYLLITHFDKDHVGGAAQLLADYTVLQVIQPDYSKESDPRTEYETALAACGITPLTLTDDTVLPLGDATFTLLPTHQTYDEEEDNNYSILLSVAYNGSDLLFMGDAKKKRVEEFLETDSNTYDFIKFPAHGAYHKAIDDLLDQTQPECVAITCSNKYPADQDTLDELAARDITVYQTVDGNVQLTF